MKQLRDSRFLAGTWTADIGPDGTLLPGVGVVLAPLGVASTDAAESIAEAVGMPPGRVFVVLPDSRPSLAAEEAGFKVVKVELSTGLRQLLFLARDAFQIRILVERADRKAVVWADSPSFSSYDAILRAGAWCLGIRTLYRVEGSRCGAPDKIRFRPLGLLKIAAGNARAYRALRRSTRRAECAGLPIRCSNGLERVLYVRTDLAFTYSSEPGGSMSHTEGVVGGLIDCGVSVILATSRPVDLGGRPAPEWIPFVPVIPANIHPELVSALADQELEDDLILNSPKLFDAIYTRYSPFNCSIVQLALARGVPLILEFNCSEADFSPGGERMTFRRYGRKVEAELCRTASLVVVVSERVADEVRELAPTARVLVSPNGVDPSPFQVSETVRRDRRRQLAMSDDDVAIGFVGRFYVWHGLDTLGEAAMRFLSERENSRLVLVGVGPYRENILRTLAPWGDRVTAPGIVPHHDVPTLLGACDILVSPHAPIDGFIGSPVKLFEYLASGRAIVASRLEQLADVITHEETGLLVTPGVPEELADAIIRLIDDSDLRIRLGAHGRDEAFAKHTWQSRMHAVLEAIDG